MNKIEKKIAKLLDDKKVDLGNIEKVIKESIPDIHCNVEGNNLLHLVGKQSYDLNQKNFLDIIDTLINLGIDVNELNDKGQNYLHIICENKSTFCWYIDNVYDYIQSGRIPEELNVNQRDKDGKTIMHTILYNKKNHSIFRLSRISVIFDELLQLGFNEVNGFGKEEFDIFELMDIVQKETMGKGIVNKIASSDIPSISNEMKKSYYQKYPLELAKQFNDDVKHNIDVCKSVFGTKYFACELLLFNLQLKYGADKEKLLATKRLLDMGFSSTSVVNDYTFIDYAIIKNNNVDYIISLIDLALKYHFDINLYGGQILDNLLVSSHTFYEKERIYSHILNCGFKKNINSLQLRAESTKNYLITLLKKYNFKLEEDIINKRSILGLILQFKDDYYKDDNDVLDNEFIGYVVEEIVNERNRNIGLDNRPISKMELMTGVSNILSKNIENDMKVRMLKIPGISL